MPSRPTQTSASPQQCRVPSAGHVETGNPATTKTGVFQSAQMKTGYLEKRCEAPRYLKMDGYFQSAQISPKCEENHDLVKLVETTREEVHFEPFEIALRQF